MDKPTVDDIRNWSQVNFARFGFSDDAKLQAVIDRATGYVTFITGQTLAAPDASVSSTGDPADLVPLIQQAIQMRVEQVVMQGRPGHVDSASTNEVVSSFTAGSYSETRRDPGRRGEQRSLNTWPALDELLWMLMTSDRFAWWWAYVTGQQIPSFAVEEIDWGSYFYAWDYPIRGALPYATAIDFEV